MAIHRTVLRTYQQLLYSDQLESRLATLDSSQEALLQLLYIIYIYIIGTYIYIFIYKYIDMYVRTSPLNKKYSAHRTQGLTPVRSPSLVDTGVAHTSRF